LIGRKYLGFELDETYTRIAEKRLDDVKQSSIQLKF